MPRVIGAAPAILDQTLVFGRGISSPIQIKGIDPAHRAGGHRHPGRDPQRQPGRSGERTDDRAPGVLLGKQLAAKMGVSVGDLVNVISPELAPTGLALRPRPLRVAGTFELGLPEFDSTYGFVAIEDAKRLFGKTDVDFIQLRVDDIWAAPEIAASIHDSSEGDYLTEDWADMNQSLFSALSLETQGHLARHRPDRHGGRAQHRRVADPAGDGEAPRHRHPQDDGRERAERDDRSSCSRG